MARLEEGERVVIGDGDRLCIDIEIQVSHFFNLGTLGLLQVGFTLAFSFLILARRVVG